MEIVNISIERMIDKNYCGTLTYREEAGDQGILLWTVELVENTKIVVGFVQGDNENWLDLAQEYAHYFSDSVILDITRKKNKQSLESKV